MLTENTISPRLGEVKTRARMPTPLDVTDTMTHPMNREDRVYLVSEPGNDRWVKIKSIVDKDASDRMKIVIRYTGSECDETGKTLLDQQGGPMVYDDGHSHSIQAGTQADHAMDVEKERREMVARTLNHTDNYYVIRSLTGVG